MTAKGNRFGIGPVDMAADVALRRREPGPMGVAVRENAASVQETSEALVEQRRQNAADAKDYRVAQGEGRVLVTLAVDRISTDALPRDRMDLAATSASDEMDELKASIRERGQREPVEVFLGADGSYQLKTGWRRLTALRQLFAETSDPRFAVVLARVTAEGADRAGLYVDMVEENVIRQDLSFAEMAQIAIALAGDAQAGVASVDEAVNRLFRSLHKVKRAYIRAFVALLQGVDGALRFPKAVARDLGVEVARKLQGAAPTAVAGLRARLEAAVTETEQTDVLRMFLAGQGGQGPVGGASGQKSGQKIAFAVDGCKVSASNGEVRLRSDTDFATIDQPILERAVRAFQAALKVTDR